MNIPSITEQNFGQILQKLDNPFFKDYFAFYSSWFDGITTDPRLMLLPIDDHMVHRGDGVFDTCKAINRSIYLFDEHLERLYRSAEMIKIKPRFTLSETRSIILETLKVANRDNVMIRIYLSRGPVNFSVNPYDSIGSQLYVAVTEFKPVATIKYESGVNIGISTIPVKVSWMAQVKSCNYLPNVLMKKEAVDRQLDYVVAVDDEGFIAEGATENIFIVDKNGTLIYPKFHYTLKGTTLIRVIELAAKHGISTEEKSISMQDLQNASEVALAGTTLDILPVTRIEGQSIGSGKPGPVTMKLRELVLDDIKNTSKAF